MADEEKQGSERESDEQASEQAAEQLKEIKVADLAVQAVSGLISLGSVRLAGDQRDLAQARLAIDCLRALEPVLREQLSTELADELQRAVAGMQLAFAEAVNEQAMPADSAAAALAPEGDEAVEPGSSEPAE